MKLVTDIDGVVLDWHLGFIEYAESKGFKLNHEHPHDTYDMAAWFHNMTSEEFRELVVEYNAMDHADTSYPLADAVEGLIHLAEECDWVVEIIALTAFGNDPEQIESRTRILNSMFPNVFDDIHVIGLRECKGDALAELKPDVFIEDSPNHAIKAKELGVPLVILVEHPYNTGHDFPYVSKEEPWSGIIELMSEHAGV